MESFSQPRPSTSPGNASAQAKRPGSPPPMAEGRMGSSDRIPHSVAGAALTDQKKIGAITDPAKIDAMKEYMRSLGCKFTKRTPNPLSSDENLLSLAVARYAEIFGFLPSMPTLESQRLWTLLVPIQKQGGFRKMKERLSRNGAHEAAPCAVSGQERAMFPPPIADGEEGSLGAQRPAPAIPKAAPKPLSEEDKIAQMKEYLRSLGCRFQRGVPNPLSRDKGLLSLAIGKYVELFGSLPRTERICSQGLSSLVNPINVAYHGFSGMNEEYARRGMPPAQEAEAAQPGIPVSGPEEEGAEVAGPEDGHAGVSGRGVRAHSQEMADTLIIVRRIFGKDVIQGRKAKPHLRSKYPDSTTIDITPEKEQPAAPARPAPKLMNNGLKMVDLKSGRYFPDEVRLIRAFIDAHPERIRVEHGFAKDTVKFALLEGKREIEIMANQEEKRLFFMKKDIPALLFVAQMELGSREIVEEAIASLCGTYKRANPSSPPAVKQKLWAAREFYDANREGLDATRFSPQSRKLLDGMFGNRHAFLRKMFPKGAL